MMIKTLILIYFSFFITVLSVFADNANQRSIDLIAQLNGKSCKYEMKENVCVNRPLFASVMRRNDKELCIIDAAKALAGEHDASVVPALIQALRKYPNVDTGDGFVRVRSEIALVLGAIGDVSAIEPLIEILTSQDAAVLSDTASVPTVYQLVKGTSIIDVAKALGMFGSKAKDALPLLHELLTKRPDDRKDIQLVIDAISQN